MRSAKEQTDPVLGKVRRCSVCGEWWPADEEFYFRANPTGKKLWSSSCKACYKERRYHASKASEVTSNG